MKLYCMCIVYYICLVTINGRQEPDINQLTIADHWWQFAVAQKRETTWRWTWEAPTSAFCSSPSRERRLRWRTRSTPSRRSWCSARVPRSDHICNYWYMSHFSDTYGLKLTNEFIQMQYREGFFYRYTVLEFFFSSWIFLFIIQVNKLIMVNLL